MSVGNDLWWSQVAEIHEEMGKGSVHFKVAETELFYRLYTRMKGDGCTQQAIRDHFEQVFGIKYSAFYTRLRRVGRMYVI